MTTTFSLNCVNNEQDGFSVKYAIKNFQHFFVEQKTVKKMTTF